MALCAFFAVSFQPSNPSVDYRLLPPRGYARLPGAVALRLLVTHPYGKEGCTAEGGEKGCVGCKLEPEGGDAGREQ